MSDDISLRAVAGRLKLFREYRKQTQEQFSHVMGVCAATTCYMEGGRSNPSLHMCLRVARRYPDLDVCWLLTGSGEMLSGASTSDPEPAGQVYEIPAGYMSLILTSPDMPPAWLLDDGRIQLLVAPKQAMQALFGDLVQHVRSGALL